MSTLPAAVGKLPHLRQIDLRRNPITSLPETLLDLQHLEKLDLRWVTAFKRPHWLAKLEAQGCIIYL